MVQNKIYNNTVVQIKVKWCKIRIHILITVRHINLTNTNLACLADKGKSINYENKTHNSIEAINSCNVNSCVDEKVLC